MDKVIGIDISKQVFDAFGENKKRSFSYLKAKNCLTGFKDLVSEYGKDSVFVMEATGPYYMKLANCLYKQGAKVSIVNPLVIRRFHQMNLHRAKTDKKDAKTIYDYGSINKIKLWEPPTKEIFQMQQLITSIELVTKQLTAVKNQKQSFKATGLLSAEHSSELNKMQKLLEAEKNKFEAMLEKIVSVNFFENKKLLESIPGIGPRAACLLIAITNNFENFFHYKQLIAYVGMSPRIFESGTSVKGKGSICKMGKSQARKQMYISAISARFHNKACLEMYNRLKEKGKPERVIKIAIANKLLKQAIAIVKSKRMYDSDFVSEKLVA